jgi:hypothetical protein
MPLDRPQARHPRRFLHGLALAMILAGALLPAGATPAPVADRATTDSPDPLLPMLRRMDRYLQEHQVEGVTMDWRYSVIPSEEIRQTVVCQLLAYVELARIDRRERLQLEITRHADFLLSRLDSIRSNSPFDGMLAYSLLGAYEIVGDPRYLAAGTDVTNDMLAIPTSQCVLNGGLMVAMGTAEYWWLTGNAQAGQKTHDIIAQLAPYQNADGSFPHWCWGSRDIHYTAWMAMELIQIGRRMADSHIAPFLASMSTFLAGRIPPDGRAIYEESCPDYPGCMRYYYSRMTGCSYDLDSRAWTVEPAYCGLLFDQQGSAKYGPVMAFLDSLEDGGAISDLYAYWPPPSDPEYPWTTADTSVVCMSIALWTLSATVADRVERGMSVDLELDDIVSVPPGAPAAPVAKPLAVAPNPTRGACVLRYSLASARSGSLALYDTDGRVVRTLDSGPLAPGDHAPRWDGRDDAGRALPPGVYFARLRLGDESQTRRITLLR